ncbi:SDR family oxidoreductase [Streptomyces globisporus]|uniref:Oxygenase-reductase n=1 Tax=Streptomyces globisporus TaxID=1908 RepID=A0A068EI09_STRGL|nr:SDR family oxidoreductase [Streptomyces globisporus]AID47003.1 oxygenase-reductase [Streptomyces globisporus]ROV69883.1 SDR family oxidoreductase [Streptomyces globisporus]
MADIHTKTQVVVVGAGPVGLMLAGELRLGGADVVVVERLDTPTTESRASTLHARTMEILDSRGLLAELGTVPTDAMGHFGGVPLDLTLPGPWPGQWKVPQARVEELLGNWATGLGAVVLRGHELRGLTAAQDHVDAEAVGPDGPVRLRASYVVGCDGEQSAVRRLGGFGFPGADAARELIRADVAGIDIPNRRFQRLEHGLAIAARRPDGVTRVMVHEFGRAPVRRTGEPDFAEVADVWKHVTDEDISGGTPLWVNAFGDASRQAARYRQGRVLLAGDAAHQQMPVGGQALNLGLQDAVNLGWKLAAHLGGRQPQSFLDTYHDERHAVGRRTLTNIRAQASLLLGGAEVESVRKLFGELIDRDAGRAHLAGMITGLDVRHDVGPGGDRLLGARVPHAELTCGQGAVTTTALLREGRGVLLDLSQDVAAAWRLRTAAGPWAPVVDTVSAALVSQEGPLAGVEAVLVRPDGHIVWSGRGGEDGLGAALRRWFGARRGEGSAVGGGCLSGRTALVTHAGRGPGRAAAVRLAREGALVAVHHASDREAAAETVAAVERDGGRAFTIGAGLAGYDDVHRLFTCLEEALTERTGGAGLDVLVDSSGAWSGPGPGDAAPEDFDRLVAVNVKAPFFLVQRSLRNMREGGRVIAVCGGSFEPHDRRALAHAVNRGVRETLVRHYAPALARRGITVNTLVTDAESGGAEGVVLQELAERTARVPAGERFGEAVAFLAGDDAGGVTGAVVRVEPGPGGP